MNFIAAGAVVLLAFVVGVLACVSLPHFEKKLNIEQNEAERPKEKPTAPAASLSGFFRGSNWQQLLWVSLGAVVCGTAALFAYDPENFLHFLRECAVLLTLLFAMIIDRKTHLIPNVLLLAALGVGVVLLIVEFFISTEKAVLTLIMSLVGSIACLVLFYVLARLTKEGIGMGDVKLISLMGFMLGLIPAFASVAIAMFICAAVAVVLLIGKKKNKKDSLAFGPFVFLGYIAMLVLFNI